MSSSESKTSFPPTPSSKHSDNTSSVPTDLTVSSTEKKKETRSKSADEELKLLRIELRNKNALIEVTKRDYEERLRKAIDRAAQAEQAKKVCEESSKLRIDLQNDEMKKIQTAISEQLREVTSRQQHLEQINQKLREKADVAKVRLEAFKYEPTRLVELRSVSPGDMSIFEFAELVIYRHLEPEFKNNKMLQENNNELERKLSDISIDVGSLENTLSTLREENQRLTRDLQLKTKEVAIIKESVRGLDALNRSLQDKVEESGLMKEDYDKLETRKDEEIQNIKARKDREIEVYKRKVEHLSQEFKEYATENQNLSQTLASLRQEFSSIRHKFDSMEQRSEQGLSTISSFTKRMQEKQFELLEELSTSLFQHNLDERYREQYLVTIRELVSEQIRTQQYISKVSSERDSLQLEVNNLTNSLSKLQISLAQEQIVRGREEEKYAVLLKEYQNIKNEMAERKIDCIDEPKVRKIDVKNSPEYKILLKDLQLLLSHREEITDMRDLVLKLQQTS